MTSHDCTCRYPFDCPHCLGECDCELHQCYTTRERMCADCRKAYDREVAEHDAEFEFNPKKYWKPFPVSQ